MELFGEAITFGAAFFLFLALALALSFEFVNGFHDTANAVATVIYTHTLKPVYAVVWSGLCNLTGVIVSGGLVAYGIIALLPHDLVMNVGTGDARGEYIGFAMIFSLLVSAIIWNLGTWYLGLPASSTHTLIGSILGVGVANAVMNGKAWTAGLNWDQIYKVILALAVSPVVGFVASALMLLLLKALIRREDLFRAPGKDEVPPPWIRGTLIGTCTGVSFAHGYNDGQKGMGLIMLILIGILPGAFALKNPGDPGSFTKTIDLANEAAIVFQAQPTGGTTDFGMMAQEATAVATGLANVHSFTDLSGAQRKDVRVSIYKLDDALAKVNKQKLITDKAQSGTLISLQSQLESYTKYIPLGVKIAVAFALGLGTMVGWKRIVVTVGEKIGKAHLTYGQGISAETVAFVTVLGAGLQGWPVSTTHVLSSGIAGTMAANRSGLQSQTLINILLAWVLTLPVTVFLGAMLFSASLFVLFHFFGIH